MIRVGTGGWVYAPWRGLFYPRGLPQASELEYASRRLTAIEINATFHRVQPPSSFSKWREATPPDFVFTVKAPRFSTHRKVLAEAGGVIDGFVASGITELGPKLGPIVWQFAHNKRFDPEDFAAFLRQLPRQHVGVPLRHALDVRHPSFVCREFVELARAHDAAIVLNDSPEHPLLADLAGSFAYLRLMRASAPLRTGYAARDLGHWAERARVYARSQVPVELPRLANAVRRKARDVFVFFIGGAKERAPAAAIALMSRL